MDDSTPSAQYSAKSVANYFLRTYGTQHGISPLKLHKLVYLAHGWHLALYNTPLVADENAEAWQHGPVFPSLYHEFSGFGRGPIVGRLAEDWAIEKAGEPNPNSVMRRLLTSRIRKRIPQIDKADTQTCRLLDRIWDVYGGLSAWQLSAMTHKPGSPWADTRQASQGKNNADIDDTMIAAHYKNLMTIGEAARD